MGRKVRDAALKLIERDARRGSEKLTWLVAPMEHYGAGFGGPTTFGKEQIPTTTAMVACRGLTSRHRTMMARATMYFFLRGDAGVDCDKLGRG